jgi:two-component system nitrogen regulation response regulator GlnG
MSRSRVGKKALSLLVTESDAMKAVVDQVKEYTADGAPVLVLGENGSGRELIARILHVSNPKRKGEFVTVHGGSAPRNLFRSPPGAASVSTLRSAAGGTLLVKDLCELPRAEQRRLHSVLRDRSRARPSAAELDVQVVGSCDIDLEYAVDAGVFSGELFELFARRQIVVPPLRERVADIPPLTAQLIKEYGREIGKNRMTLSTRAYERLVTYPWPGNVAELKGLARRLVYRAKKSRIEAGDVDAVLPTLAERVPLETLSLEEMIKVKLATFLRKIEGYPVTSLYDDVIARVEKPMLELVMKATGSNQLRAAEILGVNRNTLRRKLTDHGLLARKGLRRRDSAGKKRERARGSDAG